jgi:protein-disulfide isomerase
VLQKYPKDVNFVMKNFPLTSIHPNAMPAAKAAVAAGKQGKFWEMHDILFQNLRALGAEQLKEYAGKVQGLDVARWEKDMNSPEVAQQVNEEMQQARAADVSGTPTFFVNGKRATGRSLEAFSAMIDEALKGKS